MIINKRIQTRPNNFYFLAFSNVSLSLPQSLLCTLFLTYSISLLLTLSLSHQFILFSKLCRIFSMCTTFVYETMFRYLFHRHCHQHRNRRCRRLYRFRLVSSIVFSINSYHTKRVNRTELFRICCLCANGADSFKTCKHMHNSVASEWIE